MESMSGEQGLQELEQSGIPVEYIKGDGDSTLLSRMRSKNKRIKKRYDKNHIIKNIGKHLYQLSTSKKVKLSKVVVAHLQKCLKYCFAKNQGDKFGLEENLRAIIPHQFGDHTFCKETFGGHKKDSRDEGKKYVHKSLPYKTPIIDDGVLRSELEKIMDPVIAN